MTSTTPNGTPGQPYTDAEWAAIGDHHAAWRGRPQFCEQRPYPGAGYWCLRDHGHDAPGNDVATRLHSDLTLLWDDDGDFVNLDGSKV